MSHCTLVPAYGRDYKSQKAVREDWESDKDFVIQNISDPDDGRYANKSDMAKSRYSSVQIRYGKLAKVLVIKL